MNRSYEKSSVKKNAFRYTSLEAFFFCRCAWRRTFLKGEVVCSVSCYQLAGESLIPENMLQTFVDQANDSVLTSRWGSMWRYAVRLYVAHFSAMYLKIYSPCSQSAGQTAGNAEQVGERSPRDLGVDIVFVQERNIISAEILQIANYLDAVLELFPYSDSGSKTAWIRTYEREWQIEDGEMHYQFHIRERVKPPEKESPMQKMEERYGIKGK